MLELYIGNKNYSSWSLRPWVLLRTHGIPFVEHVKPFARGSNFAAFRAFSPSGKVPCLRDGATVVWDSLGIGEFLAERHPGLWPADDPLREVAYRSEAALARLHNLRAFSQAVYVSAVASHQDTYGPVGEAAFALLNQLP